MRPDRVNITIEDKFTTQQKAVIAEELAKSVAELETISGEKKVSDAAFNERIKKTDTRITELAKKYNRGCEAKEIECRVRYDIPQVGKKSLYRADTEKLVQVLDMTLDEKQETLQFPIATGPVSKDADSDDSEAPQLQPAEITFRYIQDIAAAIITLPVAERKKAIREMSEKIARAMLLQGQIADREGKIVKVKKQADADKLAHRWLDGCVLMARDEGVEEITRICDKTPGCIHFADHDGDCEVKSESQTGNADAAGAA